MSYRQRAQEACGATGTVKSLKAAAQDSIDHFDPFGPDDWQEFARIAISSGNYLVLEYILDSTSNPLAMLTSIQEQCSSVDEVLLNEWMERTTSKLREKIRNTALAIAEYDARVKSNLRDLLFANPQLQTFAASKALEFCNPPMLNDVLDVIGCNHNTLYIDKGCASATRPYATTKLCLDEHHTLYNRLVATLNGLKRFGVEKNISRVEAVLNDKFRIPDRTRTPTPTNTTSKPKIISKSSGKS